VSASIPAAEAFVSFQLAQLASRNEHHTFEKIATRIARARISLNILLANGPVSAGGDQQRDAESYRTRIPQELQNSSAADRLSSDPVVVAATTQRPEGLATKIREDVSGICATSAEPVSHIVYFSVNAVTVSAVHRLQAYARDRFDLHLDVFSGDQLAVLLLEPDLVWVAEHYLELPSHLVPDPPPEPDPIPDWYAHLLATLREQGGPAYLSPASLGQITRAIRYAMWDDDLHADLPEWHRFAAAFLREAPHRVDGELSFGAAYEVVVSSLRGLGVMEDVEALCRDAVLFAIDQDRPTVMDDASNLLSYWATAWMKGLARTEGDEIRSLVLQLREHTLAVRATLDPEVYPIRSASLTSTLICLALIPDWTVTEPERGAPAPIDVDPHARMQHDPATVDTSTLAHDEAVDTDAAMLHLVELTQMLPRARAYPINTTAELFQLFAPAFIDHPDYQSVRDALDEATSELEGDSVRAERCRDRAMTLRRSGRTLEALVDLHAAKLAWFHGDTMYGAILTLRFIGKLYAELGLVYAAKLYACTAASLALHHVDDEVESHAPKALLEAMLYSQQAGCWMDAAALGEVAILARRALLPDPFNRELHPELETAETNAALELVSIRQYWPQLEQPFLTRFGESGWDGVIVEMADDAPVEPAVDERRFHALANDRISGAVFSDLGDHRRLEFSALGVDWSFSFINDRSTVLGAESLCAALQVILAELALHDPVIVTRRVHVDVSVVAARDEGERACQVDDSRADVRAQVVLTTDPDDYVQRGADLLAPLMTLIAAVHVRPFAELRDIFDRMMHDQLPNKIALARPYEDSAGLLDDAHYALCSGLARPTGPADFQPKPDLLLRPSTSLGKGYDRDRSLVAIGERYETASHSLPVTLRRLALDHRFADEVLNLRSDGWLDWQILMAIWNLVGHWRLARLGDAAENLAPAEIRDLFGAAESAASEQIPLDVILDQDLTLFLQLQVATMARFWDLRHPSDGRLIWPTHELLVRRYEFATDDVPHVDLLDCLDSSGALRPLIVADDT
jgi:hypothetical protein